MEQKQRSSLHIINVHICIHALLDKHGWAVLTTENYSYYKNIKLYKIVKTDTVVVHI